MKDNEIKYISFDKDDSSFQLILNILLSTDSDFSPPISSKVDIHDISKKYAEKASVFIAFVNNQPAGLVAYYPNTVPDFYYLSIICVKNEFRGNGIGKTLEEKFISDCMSINSRGVRLNMRKSNYKLLNSRLNLGYNIIREYKNEFSSEIIIDLEYDFKN